MGPFFDAVVSEVEFFVADPRTLSLQPCSGGVREERQERARERGKGDGKVGGDGTLGENWMGASPGTESIGEGTVRKRVGEEITVPIAWLGESGDRVCYEVFSEVCPAGVVLWENIRQLPTLTSYPGFYWYGERSQS